MAAVLVTGGTGTLGAFVLLRLLAAGHRVRVLSRRADVSVPTGVQVVQGDLASGAGLAQAVAGVGIVVHAASDFTDPQATDVDGTARLIAALEEAGGSPHIVGVSIVGVEGSSLPYYQAKRAAEQRLEASPLAWDVLRATQFHGFALSVLDSLTDTDGVLTVPADIRLQPVAADDVGERLVQIATGAPGRLISVFGGPQVLSLQAMGEAYRRAGGPVTSVRVSPVANPMLNAWRAGDHLIPEHPDGTVSWQQFLEQRRHGPKRQR